MIDALRLIADASAAQAFNFTPEEVRYILWHKDTTTATYRPTDTVIGGFLASLRDSLAAIPVAATDVTGGVTKTYLAKVFPNPADAATALSIIDGSFVPMPPGIGETAANTFINTYFGAFTNTTTAIANLTNSTTKFTTPDARFGYMQPILQVFVDRQTLVVDRIASNFAITNAAADALLRTYLHPRSTGGTLDSTQSALTLLTALATVTGPVNSSTVPAHWYTYLHVQKVATIVARLKLADGDLPWACLYGPLGFDTLPVVQATVPSAFLAWSRLINAANLRTSFTNGLLFDILYAASTYVGSDPTGTRTAVLADIATRTGWNNADLLSFSQGLSPALVYPVDFQDERGLVRLKNAIGITQRLALPAVTVLPWVDVSFGTANTGDALTIKDAIRGTFAPTAWPDIATPARNGLRERQRDAMVSFLVGTSTTPTYADSNALSNDLLMDVSVMSCATTSRIKQAISSTQTFIQRIVLNMEPLVALDTDDARQWQWMKNFRIWEANRKIFVYPENWIEPTLRDDDSPFFDQLQTDLSKGELNNETIEDALVPYLHALDEVAQLDPVASVTEQDTELGITRFHVVARTKAHPPVHYYRTFENGRAWTAWQKIDLEIRSDHLVLALYNRRPYLIWGDWATRPQSTPSSAPTPPTPKQFELRLRWSSFRHGKWGKMQQATTSLFGGTPSDSPDVRVAERLALRYQIESTTNDLLIRVNETLPPVAPLNNSIIFVQQSISKPPPTWPKIFRITGGQGIAFASPELANPGSVRNLFPRYADPSANFSVQRTNFLGLSLPDVFNYWSWQLSPTSLQLDVLGAAPSPYQLLLTSSDDDNWVYDPVFYEDLSRCFFVVPYTKTALPLTIPKQFSFSAPAADSTTQVTKTWSFGGSQVTSVLNFAPSSGGGGSSYSAQLLSNATVLARPTTHTAFSFFPFYHPFVRDLMTQLNRMGVDGVYNPQPGKPGSDLRRQGKSATYFSAYAPTASVNQPYPIDEFDFSHEGAYSLYNWELFFHVPLLIATKLAANQQFDDALRWFHYIFNPTESAAPGTSEPTPQRFWKVKPFYNLSGSATLANSPVQILKLLLSHDDTDPARVAARKVIQDQVDEWREHPFEPHRIARLRPVAYMKTVVIKYIQMLIAWGDQLFAQATLESINQALQIYIIAQQTLGTRPVQLPPSTTTPLAYDDLTLDSFSNALLKIETALPPVNDDVTFSNVDDTPLDQKGMYFCVPPNDVILGLFDTVADRLYKIRHCLNLQGVAVSLPLFEPPIDPGLLVKARAAGVDIGSLLADVTAPPPLQRYSVLVQRANEVVAEVKSLGAALLSALEKDDAEALALLRANQEINVLAAVRVVKQQAIEEANRALDGLNKSLESAQIRYDYFSSRLFMNEEETIQVASIGAAGVLRLIAGVTQAIAPALEVVPNFYLGVSGLGGHTVAETGGSAFAEALKSASTTLGIGAGVADTSGQLAGTQGSFRRRSDDWTHQKNLAAKELEQIQKQIAGAEIRVAIATQDLATHDLQYQNSMDVRDFMRDKYTNVALYDWMVSQISAIYFQAYKVAYDAAKRAERAWLFEIAPDATQPQPSFISFGYWDGLHKGLLAGERLSLDIKRMEMAYIDKYAREYELTRHIPLTMLDPFAMQQLRETGKCQISIPEALFDSDSAGHYMRRIKTVALTVAGTAGPYTPVRCTLTLLSSQVRAKANLTDQLVTSSVAVQSIVTSSAKEDGGLFETSLRDERYLPFENAGAISTWTLELPQTSTLNPSALPLFDYRTVSEVVLHMRYTAREGGTAFRNLVNANPGALHSATWIVGFSAKSVFSDVWFQFISAAPGSLATLTLPIDASHVPFRAASVNVTQVQLIRVRAPSGGSAFTGASPISITTPGAVVNNLTFAASTPLGNQFLATQVYGTAASLGNWLFKCDPVNFTSDDDFIVIVSYMMP